MSDVEKYIRKRKKRDPQFAEGFEVGYSNFKVGVVLRQAREKAGMTQADMENNRWVAGKYVTLKDVNVADVAGAAIDEVKLHSVDHLGKLLGCFAVIEFPTVVHHGHFHNLSPFKRRDL